MFRRNKPFFVYGIAVMVMVVAASLIYAFADKSKMNLGQLSVDLTFAATMGTLAALALALIAIGYSIQAADINIFIGDKTVTPNGVLQEIRMRNRGNALGNMAYAFVQIDVPQTSMVSFVEATGSTFQPTQSQTQKGYRYTNPENPPDLYPDKTNWQLLGFIQVPSQAVEKKINFTVQIGGSQGFTRRRFTLNV